MMIDISQEEFIFIRMKKFLILILILPLTFNKIYSEQNSTMLVKSGKVVFISTTNKLSFKGVGKSVSGKINFKEMSISIQIDLEDLRTGIKNRDDHMKENYLETHKFPLAIFLGTITKYNKTSGEAEAIGTLTIHGVEKKNFKLLGKVKEENGSLFLNSNFRITLKEFNIEIPRLVILELSNDIDLEIDLEFINN
jgi:polyisoprenoid-binding protein YceI